MTGERGQALVLTAALLGVAAVAIVGLRGVSDRLLQGVRDERAGQAAAAAAGTAVADLLLARGHEVDRDKIALFVADPAVAEAARGAATRLARQHGRDDPSDVRVHGFGLEVEVHVTLAGRTHIALIPAAP